MMDYQTFIEQKSQLGGNHGFAPVFMPDFLYDFQQALVTWAVEKGRAALLCDCGLGKTPMQLVWAENVCRKSGGKVLILTPLAVSYQTEREARKFDIQAGVSRDGRVHDRITIANYERLHYFNPSDFVGVVCDESSILKHFAGQTRKDVTRFMSKLPYRLLCTATAAPNDFIELGTSSEALGELTYTDMLTRFFRYLDDKGQKRDTALQVEAEALIGLDANNYYKKLSYRVAQTIGQWRLKHHAIIPFWRWVSSWARACRVPSDLGYNDGVFLLPPLQIDDHIIESPPEPGRLFTMPAVGGAEERAERRRTLRHRCDYVANLVQHDRPAVIWCHSNAEGDLLADIIPDAEQVAGCTPDDRKVELFEAFTNGDLRVLVIKPKIGAWGLNWQHCNHVVTYVTHSYEQYYQSVRRCWRFGQQSPVQLDVVATEGELRVIGNLRKKAAYADQMFSALVREMNNVTKIEREDRMIHTMEVPSWL